METLQTTHSHASDNLNQNTSIFGYGSLLWKPDIEFAERHVGYIKGFKRRFWQGNDTHRGTKHKIGRVATLVPSRKGVVWGMVYVVKDQEAQASALKGLTKREVTLGGYDVITTLFYPRDQNMPPITVTVYVATNRNNLYLGKCSIDAMAMQIVSAKGFAGPNSEYVTKMAEFISMHIPEDRDAHLFMLDRRVRELTQVCLHRLLRQDEFYETSNNDDSVE